ncbi:TIGR00730 family Rossman fold protein [Microbacterium marinilacus]|uniref:Cytokinin riboside 5'-monophosphate phosphoribohydrolase n=1 Tax=Microbacterium marinilacus TaxID=415209 RepID=A0ABP7B2M0_9MICO|nr:TIGR00730 family Rossman fold protein [Microbacterium marinilacus]MBY0688680.1 TIGR00730 family Rossman fold protein [Microbacterium marinilacus]
MSATLHRITVFTGSASGRDDAYTRAAVDVGQALAARGIGIVYGGGNVGLIGTVSTAAREAGAEVHGVMPQALVDKEIAHPNLTTFEVVPDMHARKMRMAELGDAFVALPGGIGTLEEFFEVWTWLQLGIHRKPVAVYDVRGFWRPMLTMVDRMVEEGFVAEAFRDSLLVATTPRELIRKLEEWTAPAPKWGGSGAPAEGKWGGSGAPAEGKWGGSGAPAEGAAASGIRPFLDDAR